jgi:homoserine kinase
MALTLRNDLRLSRGRGNIHIRGEGEKTLAIDENNLVAKSLDAAADGKVDRSRDRIDLHCTNRIPLARGLGSSTAAAATGILAGWELAKEPWTADRLFDELVLIDGHPDNAAACAYGGIVLAQTRADGIVQPTLITCPLPLCFIALVPDRELETAAARKALPGNYSQPETVQALGAIALLVLGLERGDQDLIREALHADVIHEKQRAQLIPELASTREALSPTPALGATVSGAGPTILVWCVGDVARARTRETLIASGVDKGSSLLNLDLSNDPATVWAGR